MTNKDLYRALSDVDPDMVLDAQPAPKRSRPVWAKAVAIAVCACLAVGVLAALPFIAKWAEPDTPIVPGETVTPEQTEQQTEVPTAGQVIGDPIQGTVFLYVPSDIVYPADYPFQNFLSSTTYGLYTAMQTTTFEQYTESTRTSPFSSSTIAYLYSQGKLKNSTFNEFGSYYSVYDRYSNENEWIDYLHGTNKIKFYVNFAASDHSDISKAPISEEQALSIAQKLIEDTVSKEYLKMLTFDHICIDSDNEFSILYVRYIHGYPTDETISINITQSGDIVYYNGYNTEKYDELISKIDLESLQVAHDNLTKKINDMKLSEIECSSPMLITSADGIVFMEMIVSYKTESGIGGLDTIITNVQ